MRTCAIITTEANDLMSKIHHRTPVILHPEDYEMWLAPNFDEKEPLTALLKPYPGEAMEAYPVSWRVNRPANDEPSCIGSAALDKEHSSRFRGSNIIQAQLRK